MALYAAGILWMTARRVSKISPAAQAVGGGCAVVGGLAVYGLSPTGRTWDAGWGWLNTVIGLAVVLVVLGTPMVAGGWAAARSRASTPSEDWLKQGILAGTVVGAVGALLITVLTIPTMLVFPDRVPLKWANPSPLVPHGTVFEIQMSLGDAAVGYLVWLLLGPLLGATLGLAGAWMSGVAATLVAAATESGRALVRTRPPTNGSYGCVIDSTSSAASSCSSVSLPSST